MSDKYQEGYREIKDLVDKSSIGKPKAKGLPKKRGQSGDTTKLNRIDFSGIPPITPEQARDCALVLSGVSITLGANPVDLDLVIRDALDIKHFLVESSVDPLASNS